MLKMKKLIKVGLRFLFWIWRKKQFHHIEWVVSYKNEEIKDNTKQVFYIFLSLSGKITGANYTGK